MHRVFWASTVSACLSSSNQTEREKSIFSGSNAHWWSVRVSPIAHCLSSWPSVTSMEKAGTISGSQVARTRFCLEGSRQISAFAAAWLWLKLDATTERVNWFGEKKGGIRQCHVGVTWVKRWIVGRGRLPVSDQSQRKTINLLWTRKQLKKHSFEYLKKSFAIIHPINWMYVRSMYF